MVVRDSRNDVYVTALVIDENTMRYGGSFFKRERTCKNRGSYMGCSECGWYLNENDRYCGGCGAKVVK